MSATADLLDVDVWLALAVQSHPQHVVALRAWPQLVRPTFCRITQLGFVRLLCNSHVMGNSIMNPQTAWEAYERLIQSGGAGFAGEPAGLEAHLKPLAKGSTATRDFWTDAYLAAFATCGDLRLITFDSGFTRYKDLPYLLLDPKP